MTLFTVYTVIFYDRHGTKRSKKYDGILIINAAPSFHITLRSNNVLDEFEASIHGESSYQNDKNGQKNQNPKMNKGSLPTGILFSGKCPDLCKKLTSSPVLAIDDIVNISKWQCQILSIEHAGNNDGGDGDGKTENVTKSKAQIFPRRVLHGLPNSTISSKGDVSASFSSVGNLKQCPESYVEPLMRKRKIVMEHTSSSSSTGGKDMPFSDIIIPIPHSIKLALRPHQAEGVAFLWNIITGSSPAFQKLMKERVVEGKGAVLGDVMGSGKTLMTIALLCALFRQNRKKVR